MILTLYVNESLRITTNFIRMKCQDFFLTFQKTTFSLLSNTNQAYIEEYVSYKFLLV